MVLRWFLKRKIPVKTWNHLLKFYLWPWQLSQLQGRLVGYKGKYREMMLCCLSLLNTESVFKLLPVFEHRPLSIFEFVLCKIKWFALWLRESRNISVTRRVLYFCTARIQMYRKEITMILWRHVFKWVDLVYWQYQWSLDILFFYLRSKTDYMRPSQIWN